MREFYLIIHGISDEDKICYFFVVDIKFDIRNANEKQLFFSEIYSPIFEKKKFCRKLKISFSTSRQHEIK